MKIGWATPLHHSAPISRFSVGVTAALAKRGMGIDLLWTEYPLLAGERRLPSALAIRDVSPMGDFAPLAEYDLLVYNIGDDAPLHGRAVDALQRRPGLCIFHDSDMRNLLRTRIASAGRAHAVPSKSDHRSDPGGHVGHCNGLAALSDADDGPLTLEWLAAHALAAVAHDHDVVRRLEGSCAGPLHHIPLSPQRSGVAPPEPTHSFDAYAEALLPVIGAALGAEPLMQLSAQLGRELALLGASPDGPEARGIAQMATDLFCPGGRLVERAD